MGSSLQDSIESNPKLLNFENVAVRTKQFCLENTDMTLDISTSPKFRKLSRESGILTLPDSALDYTSELSDLPKIPCSRDKENHVRLSGYFTCTSESPNIFEQNVLDVNLLDQSQNQTNLSNVTNSERRDQLNPNSSSELSFVTVSEVYKYIDDQEGVVLLEKRLLRSSSR